MRDWRRSSRQGLIDLGFAELPWLPVKECLTSATTGLKLTLSSQSPLFKGSSFDLSEFRAMGFGPLSLYGPLMGSLSFNYLSKQTPQFVHSSFANFSSTFSSFYSSRFWSSMVRKHHVYMCSKARSHIYC